MLENWIKGLKPHEKLIFNEVYRIAEKYHQGEIRKSGKSYIQHPCNIDNYLDDIGSSYVTRCAGWLHDTIETKLKDNPNVWSELSNLSIELYNVLNNHPLLKDKYKRDANFIINLIYRLTRKPGQTYFDYLHSIFYDKKSINDVNKKIKKEFRNKLKNKEIEENYFKGIADFFDYNFIKI